MSFMVEMSEELDKAVLYTMECVVHLTCVVYLIPEDREEIIAEVHQRFREFMKDQGLRYLKEADTQLYKADGPAPDPHFLKAQAEISQFMRQTAIWGKDVAEELCKERVSA